MDSANKNRSTESSSTGKLNITETKANTTISSVTHPCAKLSAIKFNFLDSFAKGKDEFLESIPYFMDPNLEFSEDEDDYVKINDNEYVRSEEEAVRSNDEAIRSGDENVRKSNEDEDNVIKSEDKQKFFDSCSALSDDDCELPQMPKTKETIVEMSCPSESSQPSLAISSTGGSSRQTAYRPQTMGANIMNKRVLAQKADENTLNAFEWKSNWKVPSSAKPLSLSKPFTIQNRGSLERITVMGDSAIPSKPKVVSDIQKSFIDPLWKLQKDVINQTIRAVPREDRISKLNPTGVTQKKSEVTDRDIPARPDRFTDYPKLPAVSSIVTSSKKNMPVRRPLHPLPSSTSSVKQSNDSFIQPKPASPKKSVPVQQCHPDGPMADEALHAKKLSIPNEVITVNNKPYTVLALLGKGGSCKVHSVYDQKTKTVLAVKIVNLDVTETHIKDGYKKEIEYLKMLQGSNRVIKMYDYEYLDNELRIVLEKGDTDLARVIVNEMKIKPLTPHTIKFYWSHMLEAVAEIHKFGIVHSDLKPANFLLVAGQLKLIDFGIAASVATDMTSAFRDSAMGTLNFMSPEAIASGESTGQCHGQSAAQQQVFKVSTKSDVWSLGCILYNLVYGHSPFHNFSAMYQRIQAIINPTFVIPFPPIDDLSLIDVLQSCLKRNPKERMTVEELLNHPYLAPDAKKNGFNRKPESRQDFQNVLAQIEALTPRRMTVVSEVLQNLRLEQSLKK